MLSISMMTYDDRLFNDLINADVVDMIMNFCMDPKLDIDVK